jgi:acetolactate synthase-1/3 small subunit
MRQTLIALVENKPGVLNRVASLFRRRNFNIDSLNVGRTENPAISRMTLVVDSQNTSAPLIEANLYKLVNVIDVQDVSYQQALFRELALIKVKAAPEVRSQITSLVGIFNGKIADVASDCMVIQVTANEEKMDSLVETLHPYGIMEIVQTGRVAMTRGATSGVRYTPGVEQNGVNGHVTAE